MQSKKNEIKKPSTRLCLTTLPSGHSCPAKNVNYTSEELQVFVLTDPSGSRKRVLGNNQVLA